MPILQSLQLHKLPINFLNKTIGDAHLLLQGETCCKMPWSTILKKIILLLLEAKCESVTSKIQNKRG